MGSSQSAIVPEVLSKHFEPVMAGIPDAAFAGATIAITGCSTGVGRETALAAASRGAARIYMLNRPSERAAAAEKAVRAKGPSTAVTTIDCDLQSFASVRAAASALVKAAGPVGVHILFCNAGVMAVDERATADGYDVQLQTNHLSHFLLARETMPALEKAARGPRGEARVVSQSSAARYGPPIEKKYFEKLGAPGSLGGSGPSLLMNGANWKRYHQSKLANVVFTMGLHDRLRAAGSKVKALACEPGLSSTELQKTAMAGGGMRTWEAWLLAPFYQSAEDGALPGIVACFGPDAQSGDFYAPRGGMRGPPVAVAKAGVFASPFFERSPADVPSRAVLWEASEAAVGEFPGALPVATATRARK